MAVFKRALTFGAVAILSGGGLLISAASAATITDRDSAYWISFPSGLDSAVTQYNVTATLPAGGSDAPNQVINLKTGAQNMTFGQSGSVTQNFTPPPLGSTSVTGSIVNGGQGGTFTFGYQTNNGPDFTTSWTISTVADGHDVLAFGGVGTQGFGGGGSNLLDTGGIFTVEVFISGKWAEGTAIGDGYITNLSAGYNVINDFVYDADLNATLVGVSTGAYDGTNPALGFNLVGASVTAAPELSTWAMLAFGFAGLGLAGYRKSKKSRPALTA
jgi:hypothetical protein